MIEKRRWRLAACQYPIERLGDFAAYAAKLERLVADAVEAGADLLLFPEYGAMELVSLLPPAVGFDLPRQLEEIQGFLGSFLAIHRRLAQQQSVYLAAASFPVRAGAGRFLNRVHLFAPNGDHAVQDKLTLTRFERERWGVSPGSGLSVFQTGLGGLAIAICYDVEMPHVVRAQAAVGAEMILVPSCTDSGAGHARVRIAAQARALENQCLVAMSATVGTAPWALAIDHNVGAAGVFAPPDRGFPSDGVIELGPLNQPGWIFADVDRNALSLLHADPEVFSRRDWHTSPTAASPTVRRVQLPG